MSWPISFLMSFLPTQRSARVTAQLVRPRPLRQYCREIMHASRARKWTDLVCFVQFEHAAGRSKHRSIRTTICSARPAICPTWSTARPSRRAPSCMIGRSNPTASARLHQFLLIEKGGGQARLENGLCARADAGRERADRRRPRLFLYPRHAGWVLTIASEVLDQVLLPSEGLRRVLSSARVVHGTSQMRTTMKQIFAEFADRRFARAHVLRR